MPHSEQHRFRVATAFALVYVFWGSTYLGIKEAVANGVPPELMTGTRFFIAGVCMLAYCWITRRGIRITPMQLVRLSVIGMLLLSVSNVILAWAETYVPTGLAALIIAITPLWFLLLDSYLMRGDRVGRKGYAGLALGIAGIVVLLWPKLMATTALGRKEFYASCALIFGSFSWSLGSALSKRWQTGIDPFSASGWQMAVAGAFNLLMAAVLGDYAQAHWTPSAIGAIAYLVVCGSWVGFSAYIWLLQHVPMSKVATYAYVNPVVAVFLGWFVLHETIDRYIFIGSVIVVASVALVTSAEVKPRERALPAVEGAGD